MVHTVCTKGKNFYQGTYQSGLALKNPPKKNQKNPLKKKTKKKHPQVGFFGFF
jgi:hypothetical protein